MAEQVSGADSGLGPVGDGRRRLCQAAIGGMTVVTVGTVGFPVVTFLTLPQSSQPRQVMEVSLDNLAEGAAAWGEAEGRQVVVLNLDGTYYAYDGACTHLGCIVQWDGAARVFKCPCHGGVFDAMGQPIAGPVNVPLRRMEFTVNEGVLTIA